MNKKYATGAFSLTGLLLFAALAGAQGVAQPGYSEAGVANFHGDQNSLIHAIHAIQQSTGGRVIEIRYTDSGGVPGYHAVLVKHRRIQFMRIGELSSNAVAIDVSSRPVWMLKWRGKADVHFAEHAKVHLAQAIRTAEQAHNGAPAIAAGIARSASDPGSDVHAYNVLLDVDGGVQRVAVDDSTGQIIADPGALADWP